MLNTQDTDIQIAKLRAELESTSKKLGAAKSLMGTMASALFIAREAMYAVREFESALDTVERALEDTPTDEVTGEWDDLELLYKCDLLGSKTNIPSNLEAEISRLTTELQELRVLRDKELTVLLENGSLEATNRELGIAKSTIKTMTSALEGVRDYFAVELTDGDEEYVKEVETIVNKVEHALKSNPYGF